MDNIKKITKLITRRKLAYALILLFCASFLVYAAYVGLNKYRGHKIEKIGWVTDIHADRFKKRDVDSGLLYPKKYKEYLPKVFQALRSKDINAVIATGDNTNSGDDNYALSIKKISEEEKMDVFWVKGNHDNDEVMSILGFSGGQYYYFKDLDDVRLIVLDNTQYEEGEYDYYGGISPEQFDWIKESLHTKKNVIIAMHIPMFDLEGNFLDSYDELEKLFIESGNVKIVLAGHHHVAWQKEHNGIRYYAESALTRDGEEGGYAVIDLKTFDVQYNFAK